MEFVAVTSVNSGFVDISIHTNVSTFNVRNASMQNCNICVMLIFSSLKAIFNFYGKYESVV